MGKVVSLDGARVAREEQRRRDAHAEIAAQIRRGEGCPWSEEALVEGWSDYVRRSWRPRRGIKRGCIKRVMRKAYAGSDRGTQWLAVYPLDLILVALPDPWGGHNLEAATYLTMLFYDYLWRIAAISTEDKRFALEWCRKSQQYLLDIARG